MAGRRLVLLVSVFAASMAVVVVAAPAPKPDERRLPREVQEARAALERLRRLAADPKVKPEEVWKDYLAFRLRFSGTAECVQAAQVMSKVPSPLDKLDRKAIPPEDRPPWLPKEVVAVLGEHRGRHWRPIRSIKFSKDGRQVISTGDDGVRTWDVATLQERTFRPLDDSEHDVPLGSDGKRYLRRAITSLTGAKSWRFTEFRYVLDLVERGAGKPAMLASLHRDLRFIRGVTATPDGQVVIASEEDWSDLRTRKQSIGVWDRKGKTYQLRCQLDIARTGGTQVQLALRGKILVDNGDEHAALRVWDISAGKPRLLKRLSSCAGGFVLAADGKTLVAPGNPAIAPVWATAPPTVRVIELTPRGVRPLVTFDGPWKTGYPYGVSPDSSLLVVGNLGDKALWLCPLTAARRKDLGLGKGESARSVPLPEPPTAVGFSGDMRLLAVAGFWTLGVWDWQRRKELVPLSGHRGPVQALSFAPDGSMLVTGGREGTMALWEWAGRRARLRHYLRLASGPVELVAFAPDGKSLVSNTSGDGKGVRFWDISGPRPVERGRFQPHSLATRWLAFGPQEDVLLTVGENRDAERNRRDAQVVCLWDCHSVPPELRHIIALNDPSNYDDRRAGPFNMRTAVLSPSGKDLAIVQAGTVRLWDLRGRSPKDRGLLNERIPGKSFNALAFSPDGESLFAVGHGDRHLQLRSWRISSRACKEQAAIRGRIRSEGKQLAFAPDGNRLAWVEGDGRCVVWDVVRRKVVVAWLLPGEPSGVTFAPDSRHLAMTSPNGTAYILRLPAVATDKDR